MTKTAMGVAVKNHHRVIMCTRKPRKITPACQMGKQRRGHVTVSDRRHWSGTKMTSWTTTPLSCWPTLTGWCATRSSAVLPTIATVTRTEFFFKIEVTRLILFFILYQYCVLQSFQWECKYSNASFMIPTCLYKKYLSPKLLSMNLL